MIDELVAVERADGRPGDAVALDVVGAAVARALEARDARVGVMVTGPASVVDLLGHRRAGPAAGSGSRGGRSGSR